MIGLAFCSVATAPLMLQESPQSLFLPILSFSRWIEFLFPNEISPGSQCICLVYCRVNISIDEVLASQDVSIAQSFGDDIPITTSTLRVLLLDDKNAFHGKKSLRFQVWTKNRLEWSIS